MQVGEEKNFVFVGMVVLNFMPKITFFLFSELGFHSWTCGHSMVIV